MANIRDSLNTYPVVSLIISLVFEHAGNIKSFEFFTH